MYIYTYIYICTTPKKLSWWGWSFRFCRHISGKHVNGLYKTKTTECEQFQAYKIQTLNPTFDGTWGTWRCLQNPKSWKSTCYSHLKTLVPNTPSKVIPEIERNQARFRILCRGFNFSAASLPASMAQLRQRCTDRAIGAAGVPEGSCAWPKTAKSQREGHSGENEKWWSRVQLVMKTNWNPMKWNELMVQPI